MVNDAKKEGMIILLNFIPEPQAESKNLILSFQRKLTLKIGHQISVAHRISMIGEGEEIHHLDDVH